MRNKKTKRLKLLRRILVTAVLAVAGFTMIVPFLWMLSASMKRPIDVMELPIRWIPKDFYPDNYLT